MDFECLADTVCSGTHVPDDIRVVRDLGSLIESRFREEHSPEYYSGCLYISLKRLNRLVLHYHNKTVYQLIQRRLQREAELLLRHTTLSAKQIAHALGVCDPAYFSRCFKQNTGLSPLEYRKTFLNKSSNPSPTRRLMA